MLDSPWLDHLADARRVFIAGCGGGYDVLGAIPLRQALRARGCEVELGSLSFAYWNGIDAARQDPEVPNLYAVAADAATERSYCPEAWLARWLDEAEGGAHVLWCFDKTGVRPLARAYRALRERLAFDAIVLVDGGVDAVLRGDETSLGTPAEDLTSLAAATSLEVPVVLACVGMTAELRDGIAHAQVFERFAELAREGGYLGASGLVAGSQAAVDYLAALDRVTRGQQEQRQSHVHRVVSRALHGEFGDVAPHVWLSPLASTFWFLDAHVVKRTHLFLDHLRETDTIWDVNQRIEAARATLPVRPRTHIPI